MVQSRSHNLQGKLNLILLLIVLSGAHLHAQLSSTVPTKDRVAQAKSEEELDAYISIVVSRNAREVLEHATQFLRNFPRSELRRSTYEYQLHAFSQLNDLSGVMASSSDILKLDPDSFQTMLVVAAMIANKPHASNGHDELLSLAADYCRRVLEKVETSKAPRTMTIEAAEAEKKKHST